MPTPAELRSITEALWYMRDPRDPADYLRRYVRELLPQELEYARQQRRVNLAFSGGRLVLLVGYSLEPLLQMVVAFQPREVLLVLSERYGTQTPEEKRREFEYCLGLLQEALLITAMPSLAQITIPTAASTGAVFRELRANMATADDLDRTMIDITGGKKSTVAGTYLFAATYGRVHVSYVDFEEYDPVKGLTYGFSCLIREVENPYEVFRLREWEQLAEAYEAYSFRRVANLAEHTIQALRALEDRTGAFAAEVEAIGRLKQVLYVYEAWENGDYRGAKAKADGVRTVVPGFRPPTAVEELGDIWWIAEAGQASKEAGQMFVQVMASRQALVEQLFREPVKLCIYARDELNKVDRLIRLRTDYRSAVLRAAGLSEVLLKARLLWLWEHDVIGLRIDGRTCRRQDLHGAQGLTLPEAWRRLRESSNLEGLLNFLRGEPTFTFDYFAERQRCQQDVAWAVSENDPVRCEHALLAGCTRDGLGAQDLRRLRNQAIHSVLSVPREVAEAARELARVNLDGNHERTIRGYQKLTEQRVPYVEKSALPLAQLCEMCGVSLQRDLGVKA